MAPEITPNPLRSLSIPPTLISDNGEERLRSSFEAPHAFISTKHHPTLPLFIHNYNQCAFWSSSPLKAPYLKTQWQTILDSPTLTNPEEASLALVLASRALVTHKSTGEVISRSFSKFFNFNEDLGYKPTGEEFAFEIQEKVDGSIISLFWYDPLEEMSKKGKGPRAEGQWIIASKTSFSSQPTDTAWNILKTRFPTLLDAKNTTLDKSKTYVFEVVDGRMPIKIRYPYGSDLVLLSIIAKDGSETRWDERYELDKLPFRRPQIWKQEELLENVEVGEKNSSGELKLNPTSLSKLERKNEEGFVVTFWRTKEDTHPQRLKVKLECYLKLEKLSSKVTGSLAKMSIKQRPTSIRSQVNLNLTLSGPPSPASLLQIYISYRKSILSFADIHAQMSTMKDAVLDAIRDLEVMDDYGGEPWLVKISAIWDRIGALMSIQEDQWKGIVKKLETEGYKPRAVGKKAKTLQEFETRLTRSDIDRTLKPSLRGWFEGKDVREVVRTVVESMEFPQDLQTKDVILC